MAASIACANDTMSDTRPPAGPSASNAARREAGSADRLGFYRLLASFPALGSYRAKFVAVVAAGFFVPAFLVVLAIVLGAGRLGLLTVIALVVSFAVLGFALVVLAMHASNTRLSTVFTCMRISTRLRLGARFHP